MKKLPLYFLVGFLILLIGCSIWLLMPQNNETPQAVFKRIIDPNGILDFKTLDGFQFGGKSYPVYIRFEADGMSEFLTHEAYESIDCVTFENKFELPEDFEFDFSNDWMPIINDQSSCYIEWYASKDWYYAHHRLLITPDEPIYFYGG